MEKPNDKTLGIPSAIFSYMFFKLKTNTPILHHSVREKMETAVGIISDRREAEYAGL